MRKRSYLPSILPIAIVAMATGSVAHAQATRTWISGVGDDVNPCSRTAPCKTFAGAISKTATGGIINVLDPGGFGTVTITKSIILDGGGVLAGILSSSTNGININAAGANVTLRNLDIEGAGTGLIGVNIIAAQTVHIENCVIFGFAAGTARGINDTRSSPGGQLYVSDTIVKDSGQSAIFIGPSAPVTAMLDRVQLTGNGNSGLVLLSNATATITDSVISGNTFYGLFADGTAILNSENTRISNNGSAGAITTNGGTMVLANDVIVNNGIGFSNGGTMITYAPGTNKITGNTNPNVGFLTTVSQQ